MSRKYTGTRKFPSLTKTVRREHNQALSLLRRNLWHTDFNFSLLTICWEMNRTELRVSRLCGPIHPCPMQPYKILTLPLQFTQVPDTLQIHANDLEWISILNTHLHISCMLHLVHRNGMCSKLWFPFYFFELICHRDLVSECLFLTMDLRMTVISFIT